MSSETQHAEISPGHTPGPWDAIWWDADGLYVGKEDTSAPVDVVACIESNNEADARLIAAAPDLLEALERLADRFAFDGVPEDGEEEYEEALAAIRKACGEGGGDA